jgi:hypothetical protein
MTTKDRGFTLTPKNFDVTLRSKGGFTFIETLVGVFLLIIVIIGIFTAFQLLFAVLSQSQGKVVALALANEQIEIIRNLPYQDIGTEKGVPSGSIPQTRVEERNNRFYTIKTDIIYIDDPFDGFSPDDELAADYKKARVEVSWQERSLDKSVIEIANFSPPNLESEVGGGTLSMYVNNRESGQPIANAQVEIINNQIEPSVHLNILTDDNGWLSRPGLISSDNYEVRVTQAGYDEHRTYNSSDFFDPESEYSHAQLIEGDKTTRYFLISKISAINLKTVDPQNSPMPEVNFGLKGGRSIGVNPGDDSVVYSYENDNLITDTGGEKQISGISSGDYYFEITSSTLAVLTPNLNKPLAVESDNQQSITIVLTQIDQPYLRLLIKDADTGNTIPESAVRLYNDDYDKTCQSNEDGIAIFPFDGEALINGDYNLSVSKFGYQNYDGTQEIINFTEVVVELSPL